MYVLKSQISNLKPTKLLMLRIVKRYFQGCVGTFPRNAILMGDQISRRSLLQRSLQVSLDFPFLNKIWSDYQHQDQWFKQRGNSTMYQRRWLEIPLGNLMSENQIIHEYLIFLFIGHNDFPIASGFSASIQLLMWCLLLLKGDLTTPKVSHFFKTLHIYIMNLIIFMIAMLKF